MVPTKLEDPWGRSSRDRAAAVLDPASRPLQSLLDSLRARVEQGCPFDLARRACGISDATHEAWLERGLKIHDRRPDRTYRPDGTTVLAGSLEPEAEYVRILTTVQAGAAATLVSALWGIAKDPGRKRDQLAAITTLLRGMGERAFDPRSESDVNVVAMQVQPAVDQSVIDAMTSDERAALRDAARAESAKLVAAEAAIEAAKARAAMPPAPVVDAG